MLIACAWFAASLQCFQRKWNEYFINMLINHSLSGALTYTFHGDLVDNTNAMQVGGVGLKKRNGVLNALDSTTETSWNSALY